MRDNEVLDAAWTLYSMSNPRPISENASARILILGQRYSIAYISSVHYENYGVRETSHRLTLGKNCVRINLFCLKRSILVEIWRILLQNHQAKKSESSWLPSFTIHCQL
jgi:hypothetical protein